MSPPSPLPQINKYVALKLCDFGERRAPLSPSLATGGRIQGGDLGALGRGGRGPTRGQGLAPGRQVGVAGVPELSG